MQYNVYWNQNYVASEYAFDTTRKSGEIASAIERADNFATLVDPASFTEQAIDLIRTVHTAEYVDAVVDGRPSSLAESQGFDWDPMVPSMAVAHSSGLVAAVTEVLGDPRHWPAPARAQVEIGSPGPFLRDYITPGLTGGNGYCTFNGLVVATRAAFQLGAQRVLVLDLDAHCGGGTRSMTDPATVVQIDVSTVRFDRWSPSGYDSLVFADPNDYLDRVAEALAMADRAGAFDLVLYNAGMDPSDSGVSETQLRQRERMVAEWAGENGHRLVYALAGGYTGGLTMDELVALHLLTVSAFG